MDTNIVDHELRAMAKRNVTIVLDEDTAHWIRVEAAKNDKSVSQYVGELVVERRGHVEGYDDARRRHLSRAPRPLRRQGGALPPRSELHEREGEGSGE